MYSRFFLIMLLLFVIFCGYGCSSNGEKPEEIAVPTILDVEELESRLQQTSKHDDEATQTMEIQQVTACTTTEQQATENTTTEQQTTEQQATENTTTVQQTTVQQTTTQTAEIQEVTTTQPPVTTTAAQEISAKDGALKEFSVTSLDGTTYTEEIFTKADVNVVIFWTTWCGYCKMEMPALQKVMEKYSGQSIQFFNVVLNAETDYYKSQAQDLLNQLGVTYPCLVYNDSMSDGYVSGITGYPRTIYLNREGKLMLEISGAYAGNGEDYAVECHSYYVDFYLKNPN